MKSTNSTPKKEAMLAALERSLGVVSPAAEAANDDRKSHYNWLKNDPEYKAAVDSINEKAIDFAESALHKLISSGNPAATIFYCKTKGRNRGYVERQEVEVSAPKGLSWLNETSD